VRAVFGRARLDSTELAEVPPSCLWKEIKRLSRSFALPKTNGSFV
jgi:hypothetical protein